MPKYSGRFLIGACFVFVLATAAWAATYSASYQKCLHDAAEDRPALLFLRCEGAVVDEHNGLLGALATIAIAAFTLTLWRATTEQGRLTRETLKLARDEFNASHRPEIIIHSIEFRRIPGEKETEYIGASILCFNKGRAAAKDVEVRGNILVTDSSLGIDIQRPLINTFAEIPSGIKLRFEIKSDRPVSDLRNVLRYAAPYCIGWVAYMDQNQTRRETAFCFVIKELTSTDPRWVSAESPEHEYAY